MKEVTAKEKAERYDSLQYAIDFYREEFSKRMCEAERKSRVDSSLGVLMLGKTYAYSEMLEVLGRWAANPEEGGM